MVPDAKPAFVKVIRFTVVLNVKVFIPLVVGNTLPVNKSIPLVGPAGEVALAYNAYRNALGGVGLDMVKVSMTVPAPVLGTAEKPVTV